MRDEITAAAHRRGTVGLSTGGRDSGDMQLFINLADNPPLDFEYTVFGHVLEDDLPRAGHDSSRLTTDQSPLTAYSGRSTRRPVRTSSSGRIAW